MFFSNSLLFVMFMKKTFQEERTMNIGDVVTAIYKTGKYIGEITGERPEYYTVRILAVEKHPLQGDLHHPKQGNVDFFHERKALAFREQANIPKKMVKSFTGKVPNYNESLVKSFLAYKHELEQDPNNEYCQKSLQCLSSIQKEYEFMYSISFPN
jgi:kinase-associated protein B